MKKLFGITFVCLFMMSMTPVKSYEINNASEGKDCLDAVAITVAQAESAGWSESELYWLTNAANAVYCYGYSWQDVFDAQGIN